MKKAGQYDTDENGVPRLTRDFIECKAEEVIQFIDKGVLGPMVFTPITPLLDRLKKEFGIPIDLKTDLGLTTDGRKVLGRYSIKARSISIDRSLEADGERWRFVAAHEIGHFVFHRALRRLSRSGVATDKGEIADTEEHFDTLDFQPRAPRDWIEWQANKFASSFLMPRVPFRKATMLAMAQAGIDRFAFHIFLDQQEVNVTAYNKVRFQLKEIFRASGQAIEIRLKELDLLHDARSSGPESIIDIFRGRKPSKK